MNIGVKIGVGLTIFLLISVACAFAENAEYTAVVYAPANLSVSIDAPSEVSLGSNFVVTTNVSNTGTENASKVSVKLVFIDGDNLNRRAFRYSQPVKKIGDLEGGDYSIVSWNVRTKKQERFIGNYSIVATAKGTAKISGEKLLEEERKPIRVRGVSGGFIATAAYGTPLYENIAVLRDFRDEYLITNPIGRTFVEIYYTTSPPIADVIRENEVLRTIVREGLVKPLVYIAKVFD